MFKLTILVLLSVCLQAHAAKSDKNDIYPMSYNCVHAMYGNVIRTLKLVVLSNVRVEVEGPSFNLSAFTGHLPDKKSVGIDQSRVYFTDNNDFSMQIPISIMSHGVAKATMHFDSAYNMECTRLK